MYNSTPEQDFRIGIMMLIFGIVFVILPLCVMGGLGALLRHNIMSAVNKRYKGALPISTLIVNIISCFIMGLLVGIGTKDITHFKDVYDYSPWILTTGFCGGFSTFSTVALEAVKMLNEKLACRRVDKQVDSPAEQLLINEKCEKDENEISKTVTTYAILLYIGLQMILPAMMTVLGYLLAARH